MKSVTHMLQIMLASIMPQYYITAAVASFCTNVVGLCHNHLVNNPQNVQTTQRPLTIFNDKNSHLILWFELIFFSNKYLNMKLVNMLCHASSSKNISNTANACVKYVSTVYQ